MESDDNDWEVTFVPLTAVIDGMMHALAALMQKTAG